MTKGEERVVLTTEQLTNIIENSVLPSHTEQLDNFLLWLAERCPQYGSYLNDFIDQPNAIAAVGAMDYRSLVFIVNHAMNSGYVEAREINMLDVDGRGQTNYRGLTLTFSGWSRLDEIKRGNTTSHTAFMAMKFGDPQTDRLYQDYLRGAVSDCGFTLKRLDEEQRAGLIDDQLRLEIRQSRFLIADLTHHNNGAYWEAGYAEGLGKSVIYTCRRDTFEGGVHFDTNHHLTVIWEEGREAEAMEKLKSTIRATLPDAAKLSD